MPRRHGHGHGHGHRRGHVRGTGIEHCPEHNRAVPSVSQYLASAPFPYGHRGWLNLLYSSLGWGYDYLRLKRWLIVPLFLEAAGVFEPYSRIKKELGLGGGFVLVGKQIKRWLCVSRRLLRPRYRSCAGIGGLRLTSTGGVALARRQGPSLFSRPTSNFQGCFSVTAVWCTYGSRVTVAARFVGREGGVSKSRGNCWREGEGEGEGLAGEFIVFYSMGACCTDGSGPGKNVPRPAMLGCSGKCTERHHQEVPGSGAIHGCRC